jgi:hypothetical protein
MKQRVVVEFYHRSKTVWIARGDYKGQILRGQSVDSRRRGQGMGRCGEISQQLKVARLSAPRFGSYRPGV